MTIQKYKKDNPIALRKQLIQMRLELNRQKICHESIVLLEPIEKIRSYKNRLMQGSTPLLAVAGVALASFFLTRQRRSASSLLPIVRIAGSLLPFFMAMPRSEASTAATRTDNLNKTH